MGRKEVLVVRGAAGLWRRRKKQQRRLGLRRGLRQRQQRALLTAMGGLPLAVRKLEDYDPVRLNWRRVKRKPRPGHPGDHPRRLGAAHHQGRARPGWCYAVEVVVAGACGRRAHAALVVDDGDRGARVVVGFLY